MNRLMKLCHRTMSFILVFALMLGLCANGIAVFAVSGSHARAQKDELLKDFFGDGVSTEEAFENLLADSEVMNDYQTRKFQYVSNKKSYYVALGDETAAVTKRQKSTYVDKLANMLGVSVKNLAVNESGKNHSWDIQNAYDKITEYSSDIAKADLITIGWSNYAATFRMCQYMGTTNGAKVTDAEWEALVGKENMPKVEDLLNQMFQKLKDHNLSKFDGYDLEGGLEWYAYTYICNVIHQAQIIEAIRVINANAVIVLVGTYNDLENVSLKVNGQMMELGDMMGDLVNVSNYLAVKNAEAYARVTYVHVPDVTTSLDEMDTGNYTPGDYVWDISGRLGLPNPTGHEYIAKQIKNAMSSTCNHIWDDGVTVKEPTCAKDGETKYICSWCGESKTEKIPMTNEHNYVSKVTKEPSCETAGVLTYTCSNCSHSYTEQIPASGHSYEKTVTSPTCTEEGYTTYTCACGHSYVADKVAATGHSFGDWVVTKAPTCEEDGEETRTCSVCNTTEKNALSATGHNYKKTVTAPTCTEEGYTTYTCACGHSYVADKVAATGHSFGDWVVTKAPTCEEDGEETRTCGACNATERNVLGATGHSYEKTVTAPTCTEDGYTTYTCACGHNYVADEVAATGHNYGDWYTVTEPGEYTDGLEQRDCQNCDHKETRIIAALGHTHSYDAEVTAPTCTEGGYTTYTCVCGHSYVADEVAATGHSFGDWVVTKAPTCEEDGEETHTCGACNATERNVLGATGHSYEKTVTAPTCTEDGYTTYTCACGHNYVADEVAATGHNYGDWYTVTEPGEYTDGLEQRDCQNCDHKETRIIAALGHTHSYDAEVTAPTCTEGGYTTYTCVCGHSYVADEVAATGHSFGDWVVTKTPTCAEEGEECRTCGVCNATEKNVLGTTEHSYETTVTEPTCTEKGYTTHTCSNCGASYTSEHVDALGHQYESVVTAPTCTKGGYTTYTCHCGDSYVDDHTDATGHSWDEGVITKEPTTEAEGEKIYTCANCGETYVEILAKKQDVHYEIPEDNSVIIPDNDCFEDGTTVTVEVIGEGDTFQKVVNAMKNVAERYVAYEFTALKDNVAVQPNGNLGVTFAIPADYSTNVAVYYMTEDGKLEKLDAVVDAENRTITVELMHFSTYIIADQGNAPAVLIGDVNGDGKVTTADARMILLHIVGKVEAGAFNELAADVNGDGNITTADARMILLIIVGKN